MSEVFAITEEEREQIAAECAAIIDADNITASVYRPSGSGHQFDGPAEDEFTLIDRVQVDFKAQPDSNVLEPDCDCVADTPGDRTDDFAAEDDPERLLKADRVTIQGKNYRIRHLQRFGLAGADMFTRMQLKREYQ